MPDTQAIPTSLVGVLVLAVAALATVVAYLFKYYSSRLKDCNDALIKAHEQCAKERVDFAKERELWAAERSRLEEQIETIEVGIRSEYDAKHIRLLEAHAAHIQKINDDAREHENTVRREHAHNMDTVAAKSAEATTKLGLVLEKFYDRYVSPRKGPRS